MNASEATNQRSKWLRFLDEVDDFLEVDQDISMWVSGVEWIACGVVRGLIRLCGYRRERP